MTALGDGGGRGISLPVMVDVCGEWFGIEYIHGPAPIQNYFKCRVIKVEWRKKDEMLKDLMRDIVKAYLHVSGQDATTNTIDSVHQIYLKDLISLNTKTPSIIWDKVTRPFS